MMMEKRMQYSTRRVRIFRALVCAVMLCCACMATCVVAAEEEADNAYYTRRIAQADLSVCIPVRASADVLLEAEGVYGLQIHFPETPDTTIVFYAILNSTMEGRDIADMSEQDLQVLASVVSPYPDLVKSRKNADVLPGRTVAQMQETRQGGFYSEHMVLQHGPWVINVMVAKVDGSKDIEEEALANRTWVLRQTFNESMLQSSFRSYTFPDSDVTLNVPDSTYMMRMTDGEDYKCIAIPQPGTEISTSRLP